MSDQDPIRRALGGGVVFALFFMATAVWLTPAAAAQTCINYLNAEVVALDQPYSWNRLGAVQPHGMIYALRRDVVKNDVTRSIGPTNVRLRDAKRPRPLVLRMNVGDCMRITFRNWLHSTPVDNEQPATREASIHVVGMQLVSSIADDGSWVGDNASSLTPSGGSRIYTLYGEREGSYLLHSNGALVGGEGENGTIAAGLFGTVNVEPANSIWYRSQVTNAEMLMAAFKNADGSVRRTPDGQPILNYNAVYPFGHPFSGKPILKILDSSNSIFHSDLTAIIAGTREDGRIFPNPYSAVNVKVSPERDKPFREFTIIFHDEIAAVQAFPQFNNAVLKHTLHSARDAFAINYGTGGIGAEILANRLGVGPMADCTDCLYEEFFLTSWAVGDPAMVVDKPANAPCTTSQLKLEDTTVDPCAPTRGRKATKALYPDDPSNVYHSYLNDHVKFRNVLAGSDDHHIFHLHAHQWLHTPDGDNSTYLDSQAIGQGTSFTYEIAHEGSGNRNKTPGDSIFHCHFYPHLAQGMWGMWRTHDVFEEGMVMGADGNPGYPFYIPGVAGHRPPRPPLDVYVDPITNEVHDGGLKRHVIVGGTFNELHTRLTFEKHLVTANAIELAEGGEKWEQEAMDFHADVNDGIQDGFINTYTTSGGPARFALNGADPQPGAPYADPCLANTFSTTTPPPRRNITYKAANIQMDVVLNKVGWHFPQERFLSLWRDVDQFLNQGKPPEPFFFRANTFDCVNYLHTNLVPAEYELDDFQVRTPTDILG